MQIFNTILFAQNINRCIFATQTINNMEKFKTGDQVFDIKYGWGFIEDDSHFLSPYSLLVDFNGIKDTYTDVGQSLANGNVVLSKTEYGLCINTEIDQALQQLIGYVEGRRGATIEDLAVSMGLTKQEWLVIKEDIIVNHFNIREELDEYFNRES